MLAIVLQQREEMQEDMMNFGVLGSGVVAQTIGGKLVERGHSVMLGTRDAGKLADWKAKAGAEAKVGSFADAAASGEIIFNCTNGQGSLPPLKAAEEQNLNGKILVDVANPLDFSKGMPPSLTVCNTGSLAEQIQRTYPKAKVVKTLNMVTAALMVNPGLANNGDHDLFISGNDADAKAKTVELLKKELGWQRVIDLGDITTARGTEMLLPLCVHLIVAQGSPMFNFKVVK
jgi:predicted dinucleotide-binding enzyme